MIKNYYYLNRAVIELQNLINSRFNIPFTQEKNKLVFALETDHFEPKFLLLSVDQNYPYILLRENYSRAKKNCIDFFNEYFPAILTKLEIAYRERVIKYSFENFDMYYSIKGKDSNICVVDKSDNFLLFKAPKKDKTDLKNFYISQHYSSLYNLPLAEIESLGKDLNIKNLFPEFGARINNEIKLRSKNIDKKEIITQVLYEIQSEDIAVWYNRTSNEIFFQPATFFGFDNFEKEIFSNYQNAVNFYLRNKYTSATFNDIFNQISTHISRELNTLTKKLNNLRLRIENGNRSEEYQKYGDLILMNLNNINNSESQIELIDPSDEKTYLIKYDSNLSPQQNASKYYEKSKDEKINYEVSKQLFIKSEKRYKEFLAIHKKFEQCKTLDDLINLKKELKIDNKSRYNKLEQNINYRHYVINGKYHVFVGKDSKSNDLLTTKFAKQNDYWFHARGYSGSHVVLRVDNPKEGIPKNILKDTASIAAFYSKGKTAKTTPVSYTFRKYVRKNKGMAPGKVLLMKEEVLLVSPQIPDNCEIVDE